jgi:hypothetical protein
MVAICDALDYLIGSVDEVFLSLDSHRGGPSFFLYAKGAASASGPVLRLVNFEQNNQRTDGRDHTWRKYRRLWAIEKGGYISRVMSQNRPDWSRPLPQPLHIFDENDKPIITLKTLGDVRKMLLRLPEPYQLKTTWGHVGVMLDEAARGGDIIDVVVPLRMVLGMEGVACRPK